MSVHKTRGVWLLLVALLAVGTGAACNRGDSSSSDRVPLDGTPRVPDAEGVVEDVSTERLVLDGGRTYRITRDLQSFSTQTMEVLPVLQRKGQYVHVGLDGDRVAWIAAVGSVLPGSQPTVYYTGVLKRVASGKATFDDGTVLTLDDGVEAPALGSSVVAEIDPATHRVRAVTLP